MEFLRARVFTSLNADELRAGDKVIVADTLGELQRCIGHDKPTPIVNIKNIDEICRFNTIYGGYALAYLVERAENCTNCGKTECAGHGEHEDFKVAVCSNWIPKAEPKTEKEDNMWNYESLPERQEMGVSDRVVVAIEGYNIVDIGYYDYDLEGWFVEGNRYPVRVYAWQSIKPPKVEE